jgi:hypothetical protein
LQPSPPPALELALMSRPRRALAILRDRAIRLDRSCRLALQCVVLVWLLAANTAPASDRAGNVYVAGELVRIELPQTWAAWRAIDIDGNEIAHGRTPAHKAELGKLPVGYFEVRQGDGPGRITAAVVAQSSATEETPIAVDAAMSWLYADPQQIRDACTLCRLAGVRWVRDRLSWPEIETARGKWADETRYERAMRIQHEAGLKILQVNHISPGWASENPAHFPADLRDVYNFYRGLARRWSGLADAIEPWNEPDIELFGGNTGCEIASFQKAACLGLKAGDPQLTVCQSVFAIDRAETLDEFRANEVYPYFDRYDLHHYVGLPAYSRAYGRHRAASGGRPMWTTEFNLPVVWADEKTKEPSDEELRVQAFRVGKVFANALHEGAQKAFYFLLGDYVERNLQYGLVHQDLTPRPAYVAFAAVGRLLNAAQPIGRVDFGNDLLKGYVFRTQVDGASKETLVAWSETVHTPIDLRQAEKAFDYLGRELHDKRLTLTRQTLYFVLPPGGSKSLNVEPPPPQAAPLGGEASPIVLQLVGQGDPHQSAFRFDNPDELQLVAYNFGRQTARGRLSVVGAAAVEHNIELAPAGRSVQRIRPDGHAQVTARIDVPHLGRAVVVGRIVSDAAGKHRQ